MRFNWNYCSNWESRKNCFNITNDIYDFNFNFSYEYVNNKQYLDKIYKRHTFTDNDTMKRYNLIYDTAKKYIKEKTK